MVEAGMRRAVNVITTHNCQAALSRSSVGAAEQNYFHSKTQSCHVAPNLATHYLALWNESPWQHSTISLSLFLLSSSTKPILPTLQANIGECHIIRHVLFWSLLEPKGHKIKHWSKKTVQSSCLGSVSQLIWDIYNLVLLTATNQR